MQSDRRDSTATLKGSCLHLSVHSECFRDKLNADAYESTGNKIVYFFMIFVGCEST